MDTDITRSRVKALLLGLFDLRSIILGISLFNFTVIWMQSAHCDDGLDCFICPWFCPWSFTNPPTLLLLAACGLRINRWWGSLIAIALTLLTLLGGFPVNLYVLANADLHSTWEVIAEYKFNLFLSWEGQYVFSCIILTCAEVSIGKYLLRYFRLRTASTSAC
jgi:hypothetical protein